MNPLDHQLDRLFRAARLGLKGAHAAPPFGAETRFLAAWRSGRLGETKEGFWDTRLLFRGLVLASLLMVLSLWPAFHKTTDPFAEYLQLADVSGETP